MPIEARVSIRFVDWEIRPIERRLIVKGTPVPIGSRAFDLLMALIARSGEVMSRESLLDDAWPGLVVEENNLSVQITTLRKILGADAITTVHGRGYRFSVVPLEEADRSPDDAALSPGKSKPGFKYPETRNPPGNLAARLPLLIGREEEVSGLARLVRASRVVSVVGAGGIGKTRLAQAAVFGMRDEFDGGVWFIELAPISDPTLLVAAVATTLGLTLPGLELAELELASALRDTPALLVLDNCEHLVEAASSLVNALFAGTHHVHVLATSQELLKHSEEQLYPLNPLSIPCTDAVTAAEESGAVQLLAHRIRAVQPSFVISQGNCIDLVEICRRLDGLPLAIELAAARVPLLGLVGVKDRLTERFRLLTGGPSSSEHRHRTLRATLEWSHSLLTADEQAVFRRIGAFSGGFGLAHAQRLLAHESIDEWGVLDLLHALVKKSLVTGDEKEPPRYGLLESTRAYAHENLQLAGEAETTFRRHANVMVGMLEQSLALWWELPSQVLFQRYLPDLENVRAALDWSAQSDGPLYVALAGASAWLFGAAGQGVEGIRHCEAARARVDDRTPPGVEARLEYGLCGLAHYSAGNRKLDAAARAVTLYRSTGDRAGLYSALGRLAITAALSGDCAAGEVAVDEMAQLWDAAWPPLARWDVLNARDFVANLLGRRAEGEALAREQLALASASQDSAKYMFALMALEQCAATRGDFAEAVVRGRELVARARRERYLEKLPIYIANLATALIMTDALEEGLLVAREAGEADRRAGILWLSLDQFAMLAFKRGRLADAAKVLGRAEAANQWRDAFREPVEQLVRDELMAGLVARLPAAELQRYLNEGAAMDDEQAAGIALSD